MIVTPVINGQVQGGFVPASSPTDWWNPDVGAFQDLGTTPAVANNDPIRQLNTQTATGDNMTNSGTTARPTLATNAINGHSGMTFNGTSHFLNSAIAAGVAPFTFIFALKPGNFVFSGGHAVIAGVDAGVTHSSQVQPDGVTGFILELIGGGIFGNDGLSTSSWVVLGVQGQGLGSGSSNGLIQYNNQAPVTGSVTGAQAVVNTLWLGASPISGSNKYYPMNLGVVAYYDTMLASTPFNAAMQSFGTYYGLF